MPPGACCASRNAQPLQACKVYRVSGTLRVVKRSYLTELSSTTLNLMTKISVLIDVGPAHTPAARKAMLPVV
jgi:hypothetical protein